MLAAPRKKDEDIFANGLLSTILFRGILIGLTTLAVFAVFFHQTGNLTAARSGALATLVITQLIHVFECKRENVSLLSIPLFNNKKLILAVLVSALVLFCSIQLPICNYVFQTMPLSLQQYGLILCYCAAVPAIHSLYLFLRRHQPQKRAAHP